MAAGGETQLKLCIIIQDDMLEAALCDYTSPKLFYGPEEVRTLSTKVKNFLNGTEIYPIKYLFGWHQNNGQTKGLLQSYFEKGHNVSLMAESLVDPAVKRDLTSFDTIDVQFATVSTDLVKKLLTQNIKIVGFAPPDFASKHVQAIFVARRCNNKPFLPKQIFLPSGTSYSTELGKKCREYLESEFLILKGSIGAASRIGGLLEYQIVKRESIVNLIPNYIKKVEEFGLKPELIISELVTTEDPYVGYANQVVHKANCISKFVESRKELELVFAGNICQKIVSNGDFSTVRKEGSLPMSNFASLSYVSKAHLVCIEHITDFRDLIKFFGSVGCICSVDFMVPVDGFPRFLELNKLAATFGDIFDPSCGSVLDQSTNLIDVEEMIPEVQLRGIEKLEDEIRTLETERLLDIPVSASKNGVELL